MPVGKLVVDKNRDGVVFIFESLGEVFGFCVWNLEAGPSVPLELCGFRQATQATDKTAGGHGKVIAAILGAFDGDWQAIGDE